MNDTDTDIDTHIPDIIDRYQEAHDRHDTAGALATFNPDAVVTDENTTYRGTEQIRGWLEATSSEYTYTRSPSGSDHLGHGTYLVRNHLSGDFPGGEVDLHYRFELHDGRIQHLIIAP